jgi:hypothetical protein
MIGVLGRAGFFDRTPYPHGKAKRWGAVGKVCRGLMGWSMERFPLEGSGLQFCFSFQTPIRASEFNRSERQFDLFVRMKGNVDAVQSKRASA